MGGAALRSDTDGAFIERQTRKMSRTVLWCSLDSGGRRGFDSESLLTRDQGDAILRLPAAIDGSTSLPVSHLDCQAK